jgi:hypothetical protein
MIKSDTGRSTVLRLDRVRHHAHHVLYQYYSRYCPLIYHSLKHFQCQNNNAAYSKCLPFQRLTEMIAGCVLPRINRPSHGGQAYHVNNGIMSLLKIQCCCLLSSCEETRVGSPRRDCRPVKQYSDSDFAKPLWCVHTKPSKSPSFTY